MDFYDGKRLDEMTREELIEAVRDSARMHATALDQQSMMLRNYERFAEARRGQSTPQNSLIATVARILRIG